MLAPCSGGKQPSEKLVNALENYNNANYFAKILKAQKKKKEKEKTSLLINYHTLMIYLVEYQKVEVFNQNTPNILLLFTIVKIPFFKVNRYCKEHFVVYLTFT